MIFTRAQLDELFDAVDEQDVKKITSVLKEAQASLPSSNPLRDYPHFYVACEEGLDELVDFYLSSTQFNISNLELYDGLALAVAFGNTEVVDLLLAKYNLDPNYILRKKETALLSEEKRRAALDDDGMGSLLGAAAQKEDDKMLKCLLSHERVEVNLAWRDGVINGWTALMQAITAADNPRLNNVKLLLEHGADPNASQLVIPTNSTVPYDYVLQRASIKRPELNEAKEYLKSWHGRTRPKPSVQATPRPAPRTFQPHEFQAASAFMRRFKARYHLNSEMMQESKTMHDGLTPFVTACMEGNGLLSVVKCYVENKRFDEQELYQAIYLATWFQNDDAVEIIINKFGDTTLSTEAASEAVVKIIDQARRDFEAFKRQGHHKGRTKWLRDMYAFVSMEKFFHKLKHEVSSDEERTASGSHSGSESPKRLSDSDEPQSAGSDGSNNSPPRSPEKLRLQPVNEELEKQFYMQVTKAPLEELKKLYFAGVTLKWFSKKSGITAFHLVAEINEQDRIEALLSWGVDINIGDRDGRTMCHLCAIDPGDIGEPYQLEVLNFLFKQRPYPKSKADVNLLDKEGNTALHLAAFAGKDKLLALLLEKGGDPTITNIAGQSVLACAQACPIPERRASMITALQNRKAANNRPVMQQPAEIKYSQSQPTTYHQSSSYASPSSPSLFKVSPYVAPLPAATAVQIPREIPASQRMPAQQVGTLYATPVSKDSLKLSKNAKPAPESDPNHSDHKKKSGGLLGRVKGLF